MDARYIPDTPQGKLDHLEEECAEVIKAVCKLRRFGAQPHSVDGVSYDNLAHLRAELEDLNRAIIAVEVALL